MRVDYSRSGDCVVITGKGFNYKQVGDLKSLEVFDPKISMQSALNIVYRKLKEEEDSE